MKRIFIVCLCLSLLSLLIIPAFAEEVAFSSDVFSSRNISPSVTYSSLQFYPSVTYSHIPHSVSFSSPGYVFLNGERFNFTRFAFSDVSSRPVLFVVASTEINLLSIDGNFVDGWDGFIYFDTPLEFPASFADWYNSFPNGMNGNVSDGVSSFIGWTGNVLSNLVMSPAVLVLVGLSIAMLAVLPWGISKLKSLIKGY